MGNWLGSTRKTTELMIQKFTKGLCKVVATLGIKQFSKCESEAKTPHRWKRLWWKADQAKLVIFIGVISSLQPIALKSLPGGWSVSEKTRHFLSAFPNLWQKQSVTASSLK